MLLLSLSGDSLEAVCLAGHSGGLATSCQGPVVRLGCKVSKSSHVQLQPVTVYMGRQDLGTEERHGALGGRGEGLAGGLAPRTPRAQPLWRAGAILS